MTEPPAWGEAPSREQPADRRPRPAPGGRRRAVAPDRAAGAGDAEVAEADVGRDGDGGSLGRGAVWVGLLGLAFFGILATIVTGVLAAEAGRRAREQGRSPRLAYLGLLLALADGVWFLALHYWFDLPVWLG